MPIGENGQRVPRVELSTTFAPNRFILVGGMDRSSKGETSQAGDKNKQLCEQAGRYYGQGRYEKAEQLLNQVLNNCRQEFGSKHLRTAVAMTNLADVYTVQRNFEAAKELYEEALPICTRRLGLRDSRTKEIQAKMSLGEQVGNYSLAKFLGQGGFANVYLGEQTDSKGIVKKLAAVKLLQDTDPETVMTFSEEAGTLIKLRHPHIVQGLEFGRTEDDVPFLVMEYVPDGTLRSKHSDGTPVPPAQVVDYVVQTASALQYMHGRKLMHLDVTPANILLVKEPDGKEKLLLSDFGLVRVAHSTASQSSIDRAGGTVPYMDPELLRGGRASKKSDQRAVAVIACELLSGKRGRELGDMIYKWLGSGRCPWELSHVPGKIREVLFRALAEDPKDRFSSVGTFAGAFVEACAEQGVPIGEHLLPMTDELRKHVGKEAENAQERVNGLEDEMHKLQQENDDLKRKLESDEKIQENLHERVGEFERQGQVYQQGKSWQLEQDNRTLQEKIDELKYEIRKVEEEKKSLKNEIDENRKFYDGDMKYMHESMVDHYRDVIQEKKQDREKIIQEMAQLLHQPHQQEDHVASTSGMSSLEKGEASSSSAGREGIDHHVEQQLNEEQIVVDQVQKTDKRNKGKEKEDSISTTSSLETGEASSSSDGREGIDHHVEQQVNEEQHVADQVQKMDQINKGKEKEVEKKVSTSGTSSLEKGETSSSSTGQEGISHYDKQKNTQPKKSGISYSKSMYRSPGRFYTYTALLNIFGGGLLGNMLAKYAYKKNLKKIESKLNETTSENAEDIKKMVRRVSRYNWTKELAMDPNVYLWNMFGLGIFGNILCVEDSKGSKIEQELLQRLNKALQEKDHGASTSGTPSHERGEASSSSTGREGTDRDAERECPENVDKQTDTSRKSRTEN